MKYFFCLLSIIILFTNCNYEHIDGNGILKKETRSVKTAERIKTSGSFDIELIAGNEPSVVIEADENLLPYIITKVEDNKLLVKWKDDINVSTDNNVKLTITTPVLEEIYVQGSGNVKSTNKFTGGNELKIKISGSGDVKLAVNTPKVSSSISGSGNISLEGETKENNIEISGVGDYNASELLAESASVKISGSGNVKLHADANLNVKISGSGDVFYKGSPAITESISGSGSIKQLNN